MQNPQTPKISLDLPRIILWCFGNWALQALYGQNWVFSWHIQKDNDKPKSPKQDKFLSSHNTPTAKFASWSDLIVA